LANMSHELRTPLNSILLLSRLLVENGTQNLSGDQIEYARVIQNSGQGLLQLIDEILDLSRIESGKLPLEHAIVPVAVVLEDMRQLFGPIAKDKNLELHIVTEEGAPAQLETDKQRLEQIIKNLMANAFKFTQRGFVTLRAAPSPDQPNFIKFSVRDSGMGGRGLGFRSAASCVGCWGARSAWRAIRGKEPSLPSACLCSGWSLWQG
jgi:signal transduction histidine kinase